MKTSKTLHLPKKTGKPKAATGGKFVDRDLCSVNPNKEQFEPSGSEPVRQHYKMAGGA